MECRSFFWELRKWVRDVGCHAKEFLEFLLVRWDFHLVCPQPFVDLEKAIFGIFLAKECDFCLFDFAFLWTDLGKNVRLVLPFNQSKINSTFNTLNGWLQIWYDLQTRGLYCCKVFWREKPKRRIKLYQFLNLWTITVLFWKHELVPEAYRQRFRNYRKQESQIHVEFAHEKEVYFDRWCNSKEVCTGK